MFPKQLAMIPSEAVSYETLILLRLHLKDPFVGLARHRRGGTCPFQCPLLFVSVAFAKRLTTLM